MSRPRLIALLLALVTLMIYLPVVRHAFLTYDDDEYVTNNSIVQSGLTWSGVRWAFTTFHSANWHPLTWMSHMADCDLFQLNAGAHHLVSALIHAANAALLFVLFWRLTAKLWPSALVAALFAWHPVHVESVAWVAERKDVLSTCLALVTLLSYVKFAREKRRLYLWLAVFLFALGLMAKPMLVTLPFLLLLLDFWPLGRLSAAKSRAAAVVPLVVEKIPFFLLTAASCVVTFFAQRAGEAVISLQVLPAHYRLENALVATARYLMKLFWPINLAVIYPFELIRLGACVCAGVALAVITVFAWRRRSRQPCWLMGWLWFLGTLVPVIGLVQVGSTIMADRYTYIPAIGIFAAIAFGLPERCWSRRSFAAGAAILLVACVWLTEKQLSYWRDSETLFRRALALTKNNLIAHINLGLALEQQDRTAEALAEYRAAAKTAPHYSRIHFFIGNILFRQGQAGEALTEYRQCLADNPNLPALHDATAGALAAQGNLAEALPEFAEAERLDPRYAQPHLDLAKIYFAQGDDGKARTELAAAAQAEPYDWVTLATVAHYLAANTNAAARDGQSALALALKANELSRERQPEVFDVLGMAFAATGDFSNAVICAQNALEFAPLNHLNNTTPLHRRLEMYQQHEPWLESFAGTNVSRGQ